MGTTIIDSRIFGNIFATDAMRRVWSDENRTAQYLAIEKALAIVQVDEVVSPEVLAELRGSPSVQSISSVKV